MLNSNLLKAPDELPAETEAQRRQALRQAGGALRTLYDGWAARLTRLQFEHDVRLVQRARLEQMVGAVEGYVDKRLEEKKAAEAEAEA